MAEQFLIALAIGFAVVAGAVGVVWLRNGRDPRSPDDPSLLAAAPPSGMTAATATLVVGGSTHDAFIAALLDLATRDEIAFESEGVEHGIDRVGIAIHGGETDDPRVLLDRRLPIGEAETWLLAQLRLAVTGRDEVDPSVEAAREFLGKVAGGAQLAQTLVRVQAATVEGDDSPEARAAREHGLDTVAPADPDEWAAAHERRTGKTLSMEDRERLADTARGVAHLTDPDAIPLDADAFADGLESIGHAVLPDDVAAADDAPHASKRRHPRSEYISAARARRLHEPFLFGTLLETYAKRHRWVAGIPGIRLAWRLIGIGEIVAGMVVAVAATNLFSDALIGLALGIGLGGGVTYMAAPAMASRTREGAMARSQLLAYARTLRATLASAGTIDDVVTAGHLRWLETSDQALVWGMALGLRAEIEALLVRTSAALTASGAAPAGYVPPWYRRHRHRGAKAAPSGDPASMFAGIAAIGSEADRPRIPGTRAPVPRLPWEL